MYCSQWNGTASVRQEYNLCYAGCRAIIAGTHTALMNTRIWNPVAAVIVSHTIRFILLFSNFDYKYFCCASPCLWMSHPFRMIMHSVGVSVLFAQLLHVS